MKAALLVLDVQNDFTNDNARMPVAKKQVMPMITCINNVIEKAMKENIHIIYIGNEFEKNQYVSNWFRKNASLKGSEGAKLNEQLKIVGNLYFSKKQGNAFSNSSLVRYITDNHIKDVYVVGLFAEGCVLATVKGALQNDLTVTLIEEGIAGANDKKKNNALRKIERLGATIVSSSLFLK